MFSTENIRSLSDFRQNATTHLERLAENGGVEVLTVNGQAKGVVMSPKTFDKLARVAALSESLELIDRSMEDVKAGRGKDFREAIQGVAEKLGLTLEQ